MVRSPAERVNVAEPPVTPEPERALMTRIEQMRRLVQTKKSRIAQAFVDDRAPDPALSELMSLHRIESELEQTERILRVAEMTRSAAGTVQS